MYAEGEQQLYRQQIGANEARRISQGLETASRARRGSRLANNNSAVEPWKSMTCSRQ
jgi:hypothetical protein